MCCYVKNSKAEDDPELQSIAGADRPGWLLSGPVARYFLYATTLCEWFLLM